MGLFSEPVLRKRVLIASGMQITQQFTGENAIIFYSGTLFLAIGHPFDNPYVSNVIWQLSMVLGCSVGLVLIDSSIGGRRPQLLGATVMMVPAIIIAGLALQFHWNGIFTMPMWLGSRLISTRPMVSPLVSTS